MGKIRDHWLRRIKNHSVARYLIVGGATYILEMAILIGLYGGLHLSRAFAASVSFWVGLFFSFLLQKLVAFKDYEREVKIIGKQAFWFGILILINYIVTILIVALLPGRMILISRTIALLITTLWNYIFYKKIIFS